MRGTTRERTLVEQRPGERPEAAVRPGPRVRRHIVKGAHPDECPHRVGHADRAGRTARTDAACNKMNSQ